MKSSNKTLYMAGVAMAACVTWVMPVAAQEQAATLEITPFAGYRVGGNFEQEDGQEFDVEESGAFGLTLNGPAGTDGLWEFLYANQRTEIDTQGLFVNDPLLDVDVDFYQFGGVYLLEGDRLRPFVALTLGASRFDPAPAEFGAETFFSGSLAVGSYLDVAKHFSLRLEARVYTTFVDSDSDLFCVSESGAATCLITIDGNTLNQWEARAGLVFRF